ncbi:hypothetical protein PC116_g13197 [Phytophthora cactorum]|uniref:Uncharacterized protein n=1 Tax=Phytophthora cactorum TaxID=29920 RepID=A0A8T1CWJ7_9STRA|nr:hypothetical protein PC114_g14469 [Phytophthora cactorum]KAG2929333.1 hypothetical protein PC117_g14019 [Phytophthora cactorum]KAG3008573.1 hypothetical protein PC119_g14192 [Phytophthora cactorum]KAG3013528.1 hypothetical protein PC120_g13247 [Phytophthora cactorum]KAG3155876.1 hypothetical protein C6341_g15249 [Phytophthora cactorum]
MRRLLQPQLSDRRVKRAKSLHPSCPPSNNNKENNYSAPEQRLPTGLNDVKREVIQGLPSQLVPSHSIPNQVVHSHKPNQAVSSHMMDAQPVQAHAYGVQPVRSQSCDTQPAK